MRLLPASRSVNISLPKADRAIKKVCKTIAKMIPTSWSAKISILHADRAIKKARESKAKKIPNQNEQKLLFENNQDTRSFLYQHPDRQAAKPEMD